ncbi:MAG TPA: zinc ribbon domain-containing protein [Candidatus Faecousia intestinigallinarum]|nr:zinc ribbon domain-containing protein [Candidatus Faecousia intestinigallinarum]
MAFCINCGQELAEEAKFCASCGKAVGASQNGAKEKRKTVYEGNLHKCPNCGEAVNSFVTNCPTCGHEIRDAQSVSSVRLLAMKLEHRDGGILNMQMYVDSLSEAIRSALEQMVIAANNDTLTLRRYYQPPKLFKAGDAILTFNYTSTIELLFDVPRTVPICHIHGCYEQGSSLVFGYRNNQNRYASAWADLDEEHWDYYVVQQREAVYGFYASWEKKLEIGNLMSFLSCCKGIDRVVVLGHSMSEVDAEYMEQVEIYLNPNVWEVSYYEPNDIARVRSHGYSFQRKINFATMDALLNG